jgi:hypothetical protein
MLPPCSVCDNDLTKDSMFDMLCDYAHETHGYCEKMYHAFCLSSTDMERTDSGFWFCPACRPLHDREEAEDEAAAAAAGLAVMRWDDAPAVPDVSLALPTKAKKGKIKRGGGMKEAPKKAAPPKKKEPAASSSYFVAPDAYAQALDAANATGGAGAGGASANPRGPASASAASAGYWRDLPDTAAAAGGDGGHGAPLSPLTRQLEGAIAHQVCTSCSRIQPLRAQSGAE